jgi:hypothetical protein
MNKLRLRCVLKQRKTKHTNKTKTDTNKNKTRCTESETRTTPAHLQSGPHALAPRYQAADRTVASFV